MIFRISLRIEKQDTKQHLSAPLRKNKTQEGNTGPGTRNFQEIPWKNLPKGTSDSSGDKYNQRPKN